MSVLGYLFSLRGRIGRGSFWLIGLVQVVLLALSIGVLVASERDGAPPGGGIALAAVIACLATALMGLSATVRRWHDRDKSAWWILIAVIPLIGPIWATIELGFLNGTPGDNRYGPPPGSAPDGSDARRGDIDERNADLDDVVSRWKASHVEEAAVIVRRDGDAAHSGPAVVRRGPQGGFGRRGLQ